MTVRQTLVLAAVLAVGFVLAIPFAGFGSRRADAGPDSNAVPGAGERQVCEPMPGPGNGPPPPGDHQWGEPPAVLRGIALSDEQQDRVFGILYAAAPAIHDQQKALRRAREALDNLITTVPYEETRANVLSDALARAEGHLAMLRARTDHEIYQLLTAQQQAHIASRRRERMGQAP